MAQDGAAASLAALDERRREQAMARFAALRPHLEEGVSLACAAGHAGIPVRTADRWLARYRRGGLAGLARSARRDAGTRRMPADLVALVEGMALKPPRLSAAAIHRRVGAVTKAQGWRVPSYGAVHAIVAALDPGMVTLAQEGQSPTGTATSWSIATARTPPTRSGRPTTPCSTCSSLTRAASRPGLG